MADEETIREQTAQRVARLYARAAYVTPRVTLDRAHAAALRRLMKRDGTGVSDAIRAAIITADALPPARP